MNGKTGKPLFTRIGTEIRGAARAVLRCGVTIAAICRRLALSAAHRLITAFTTSRAALDERRARGEDCAGEMLRQALEIAQEVERIDSLT